MIWQLCWIAECSSFVGIRVDKYEDITIRNQSVNSVSFISIIQSVVLKFILLLVINVFSEVLPFIRLFVNILWCFSFETCSENLCCNQVENIFCATQHVNTFDSDKLKECVLVSRFSENHVVFNRTACYIGNHYMTFWRDVY